MLRLELAEAVLRRGRAAELVRLSKYSEAQFLYYANQVPVIFAFRYADNEENNKRGRRGNSGFRQGVRNLNYVPTTRQPKQKGRARGLSITYYDLGRQAWRSFRRGNLISISAFWSEELQRFVDTPEEAGIARGTEYEPTPRAGKAQIDEARKARTEARETRKRERERIRNRQASSPNRRDTRRARVALSRTR